MKRIVILMLTAAVFASGCYASVGRTHTTGAVIVDTHHHHHHHWR